MRCIHDPIADSSDICPAQLGIPSRAGQERSGSSFFDNAPVKQIRAGDMMGLPFDHQIQGMIDDRKFHGRT